MRYKILAACIISAFLFSCSHTKKLAATPDTNLSETSLSNIIVDGRMDDWQKIPEARNPAGSILYAVANNANDLYISFKIADQAEQMKLLKGGMQIWIDPTLKQTKNTEIIYPVKGELSEENFRNRNAQSEKSDLTEIHERMRAELVSLNRVGFKNGNNGVQSIRENTGFKAAINWDENGALIYELAIPFSSFPNDIRKEDIELGFFISGIDKPKTTEASNGSNRAEGNGGGRGMNHGGGMRGGGGGRPGGGNARGNSNAGHSANNSQWQKIYENESFWVKYSGKD